MDSKEILVSVAMPNYNHGEFLKERIQTILAQIGNQGELVVVDDGSTDNSLDILEQCLKEDSRLRVIKHATNLGVVAAANRAVEEARGKYIAVLAVDDVILPGFIEKSLNALLCNPHIPLCFSDFGYINGKNSKEVRTTHLIRNATQTLLFETPDQVIKLFRYNLFGVPGHTSLLKRDAILMRGGFKPELEATCDWFLLHSICLEEGFVYIPETLSAMRLLSGSYGDRVSRDKKLRNRSYVNMLDLLQNQENKLLCMRFMRSALIEPYVFRLLGTVIIKPKYWEFLVEAIYSSVIRKFKNFPGNLIRRLAKSK